MTEATQVGDWDGLVVICASTAWDGHHLLDQPLAIELSRRAPVLYVDPPVSLTRRLLDRAGTAEPGLGLVAPGLARLTPMAPPLHQRPGVKRLALASTRRAMAQAVAALGAPRVRAVIIPSLNPLFGVCGEETKVFYAKDDYVAGASLMRLSARSLRRSDRRQPDDADLVVAVSEVLGDHYRAMGHTPMVIPNGCDVAHYRTTDEAPLPDHPVLPGPRAGVIGTLSARIDPALVEAVAASGTAVVLVGGRPTPGTDGLDGLLARERVQWVGSCPFAEVPSWLRLMDVGLVPYASDAAFNRASAPLKVLEYLAGGRPVVSSDLPAVRALDTDLVTIAEGPEAFAAAVQAAMATAHDPELVARRRAFAATHGWAERFAPLADALHLPPLPPSDLTRPDLSDLSDLPDLLTDLTSPTGLAPRSCLTRATIVASSPRRPEHDRAGDAPMAG